MKLHRSNKSVEHFPVLKSSLYILEHRMVDESDGSCLAL